jgi:hypothetical protein
LLFVGVVWICLTWCPWPWCQRSVSEMSDQCGVIWGSDDEVGTCEKLGKGPWPCVMMTRC